MKHLIKRAHFALYILLTAGFLSACMGEINPRIVQKIEPSMITDETELKTFVWHKQDIIWAEYDPIKQADSAFILMRYKQAEEIVKRIKSCR